MKVIRKEKLTNDWKDLLPVESAHVRSLDQGLLKNRLALRGIEDGHEFYRTMIVNSTYIFPSGATQYTGFVADDYEEYTYRFHVEEWIVDHGESSS